MYVYMYMQYIYIYEQGIYCSIYIYIHIYNIYIYILPFHFFQNSCPLHPHGESVEGSRPVVGGAGQKPLKVW